MMSGSNEEADLKMVTKECVELEDEEHQPFDDIKPEKYEHLSFGAPILDHMADWYVDKAVHQPCRVFCGCCFIIFMMIFVSFAVGINAATMTTADWLINDATAVEHRDMVNDAYDQRDSIGNETSRSEVAFYQLFYYQTKSKGNVFTAKNLQTMCELEATMMNMNKWDNFCLVDADSSSTNCSNVRDLSIVQIFYGDDLFKSNGDLDCFLLNETEVAATAETLVNAASSEAGQLEYGFFLSDKTEQRGYSHITRSGIAFGGPLDGYSKLSTSSHTNQELEYRSFLIRWLNQMWDKYDINDAFLHSAFHDKLSDGNLDMLVFSDPLWDLEDLRLFESDFILVSFSFIFVFLWMMVHIQSGFLAAVGMGQIFLSIPASLFFYRCVAQITYFSTLQNLVIFVVLGVGADDVFVLVDAWKQSATDIPRSAVSTDDEWLVYRMRYSYIRTAQAVLNTSFTTAVAFGATAVSPIMPISTFGVFGAVCIIMNYLFVISLTPAALIINESEKHWCKFCFRRPPSSEHPTVKVHKQRKIDEWVLSTYVKTVKKRPVAVALVVCLSVYSILSCYWASLLEAPTKIETWMPTGHMFDRAYNWNEHYLANDEESYAQLDVVWGLKGLDRSEFDPYYPDQNRGEVKFDRQFDLFDPAAQSAIYDACERLPSWPCNQQGCQYGLLVRPNTTICFLTAFDSWVASTKGADTAAMVGNEANRTLYMRWLKQFRETEYPLDDTTKSYSELIGFVDDELKFVGIRSVMTMDMWSPYRIKDPIEKRAEKFVKSLSKPAAARSVFQYTWDWAWSPTQKGTVDGMTQGMTIAFPIAFVTLLIATHNTVLSFFAIVSVGSIVACTLGMCQIFLGWDLGTAEAIAGVMVIGLAVDYTIHLGHMYDQAGEVGIASREERFEYATRKMALTVMAGAITTAGAGLFMFACQSLFFPKMATLITGTILFSLIYSMLFFMPLLLLLGPEGNFGKLHFCQKQDESSEKDKDSQIHGQL